jgi:hypothetical protein
VTEPEPAHGRERKQVLLRLDPSVYDALARWASDELRSANAQIEFLLRRALREAGRHPGDAAPIARRGRPPKSGHGTGHRAGPEKRTETGQAPPKGPEKPERPESG